MDFTTLFTDIWGGVLGLVRSLFEVFLGTGVF